MHLFLDLTISSSRQVFARAASEKEVAFLQTLCQDASLPPVDLPQKRKLDDGKRLGDVAPLYCWWRPISKERGGCSMIP